MGITMMITPQGACCTGKICRSATDSTSHGLWHGLMAGRRAAEFSRIKVNQGGGLRCEAGRNRGNRRWQQSYEGEVCQAGARRSGLIRANPT